MTETEFVTVTITGPDTDSLTAIARALVDARLAACGNIIPGVTSVYRWQDAVEQEPEALALVHTRVALLAAVTELVTRLHPYDVPQIVASPASTTSEHGAWLHDATRAAPQEP